MNFLQYYVLINHGLKISCDLVIWNSSLLLPEMYLEFDSLNLFQVNRLIGKHFP